MQVLANNPELAQQNTELTRRLNEYILGLILSGEPGTANIELIAPDGENIYPGSPTITFPDFWSVFPDHGLTTPRNTLLPIILGNILKEGTLVPSNINFSKAAAELIDANLDLSRVGLDDVELVRLSVLLQLVNVDEIAAQLQLGPEQVIEMFGLERVLAAIENGSGNT